MDQALMIFQYQQQAVRTVLSEKGEQLWIAKDVCDVLGISKHRDAVDRLDEDQKGRPVRVDTPGGKQEMATVTESGLYDLILRSDKPEAKAFRKWVTSEVLPSLRRTGKYELPADIFEKLQKWDEFCDIGRQAIRALQDLVDIQQHELERLRPSGAGKEAN